MEVSYGARANVHMALGSIPGTRFLKSQYLQCGLFRDGASVPSRSPPQALGPHSTPWSPGLWAFALAAPWAWTVLPQMST